jgi:cytochrome c-type biogenesis protein
VNNPFAEAVTSSSLLLAIPVALLAGLVSFLSPCVLPLVPGYLGYVSGLTGVDLEKRRRGRMLAGISLFILGFSMVFVLLGAVFGQLGAWLKTPGAAWVPQVLGLVVILFGIVFMGGLGWFQREAKIHAKPPAGLWGAPLLGITFGLGWAPCIGPTLSAVLAMSYFDGSSAAKGAFLTFVYCLGLGLPFLFIALGVRRGLGALAFFRKHRRGLQLFGGGMLVVLGLLMVTGLWTTWINEFQGLFVGTVWMPI